MDFLWYCHLDMMLLFYWGQWQNVSLALLTATSLELGTSSPHEHFLRRCYYSILLRIVWRSGNSRNMSVHLHLVFTVRILSTKLFNWYGWKTTLIAWKSPATRVDWYKQKNSWQTNALHNCISNLLYFFVLFVFLFWGLVQSANAQTIS